LARSRNIKPGFFLNDELAETDPLGRLLFAGLWTIADKAGRLKDSPKKIKACILPYDDCDVNELLDELSSLGFITRYKSGNMRYIAVNNWTKHQNPHVKEPASEIPAPDKNSVSTVQEQVLSGSKCPDSGFLIPDSLNLIPDSLNLESGIGTDNNTDESEGVIIKKETGEVAAMAIGTQAINWAEKNWGRMIPKGEADSIIAWCDEFASKGCEEPDAVIIEGLRCCLDADARKIQYLNAVLTDWREAGVLTVDQIKVREAERKSQKDHKRNKDPVSKPRSTKYDSFYL